MKRVVLWIVILATVAGVAWLRRPRAAAVGLAAPPVNLATADGKTVDFSSGRAVVTDSATDRAALEQAKKEMAEAAQGVTFAPVPPPPVRSAPAAPKKD